MSNPWQTIPLADYEGHMRSRGIEQLGALSNLFKKALIAYRPHSVGVLGVAGGNGFEHIDEAVTHRTVGIDINDEYLAAVRQRYSTLKGLELYSIDLARDSLDVEPVQFVHAALVFEHTGVGKALENALSFVAAGGHLSVILQLPSESTEAVGPSQFSAMQKLKSGFSILDPDWFRKVLVQRGWTLTEEAQYPIQAGKGLWMGIFSRM